MQEKFKKNSSGIKRIQQAIGQLDFVCTGTLLIRRFSCGKSNCRCQKGTKWHHGPYYDWTHLADGKFIHKRLTKDQAKTVKRAIGNYKRILKLLRNWEIQTQKYLSI
jgi:hypothetical protein